MRGGQKARFCFSELKSQLDLVPSRDAVNEFGQISYEGGPWHGTGSYVSNEYDTSWHMTFHTGGDVGRMKTYIFVRVQGTNCFLTLNGSRGLNAMLVPKNL